MRKTLLLATILFLCAGVAQAQAVYEAFGNRVMARQGGAAEKAGAIVLFLRSGDHNGGVITVRYSAPLAEGTMAMVATSEGTPPTVATDVKEGTVTITMADSGEGTVTISNVRLDLREAAAPVTATFSGDSNAFVSGVATVISAIRDALEVESTLESFLTRGDMGMVTLTLKEAFAAALTSGADVLVTLVGVPDKAKVTVSHVYPTAAEIDAEETSGAAVAAVTNIAGTVTLTSGTDTAEIVTAGVAMDNSLEKTGDGDKLNITVSFADSDTNDDDVEPSPASTESLKLILELDARSSVDDIMLPLDEGMVEVWVTMAPTTKPDMITADTEYFAVNYLPAGGVVAFEIAPASCTLLFPYVVSADPWNTGIAISNPSAFTNTPLSGTITFTLFPNDAAMFTYQTDANSPGAGLDESDGSLPAGNTYSVLLTEILGAANWDGDFQGHIYVRTDYTGCRGVGWVTDFMTVNQAYLPYFEDNLDEGDVPGNK